MHNFHRKVICLQKRYRYTIGWPYIFIIKKEGPDLQKVLSPRQFRWRLKKVFIKISFFLLNLWKEDNNNVSIFFTSKTKHFCWKDDMSSDKRMYG